MKPKRFKITMLVTVEEIPAEPHETRPELAELTARPAWFPEETASHRKPKAEKPKRAR